ncbi:hypothetical protein TcCL_Unassigned03913 [Trypanosoma cruzi]|nr:hypothetical protein TcCL_Unassigned03913 [Trypanosoma cruzi]
MPRQRGMNDETSVLWRKKKKSWMRQGRVTPMHRMWIQRSKVVMCSEFWCWLPFFFPFIFSFSEKKMRTAGRRESVCDCVHVFTSVLVCLLEAFFKNFLVVFLFESAWFVTAIDPLLLLLSLRAAHIV